MTTTEIELEEARATIRALSSSSSDGVRLRSSLRLDALRRKSERYRGIDRAELELLEDVNAHRLRHGLAPLSTLRAAPTTTDGAASTALSPASGDLAAMGAASPSLESIGITDPAPPRPLSPLEELELARVKPSARKGPPKRFAPLEAVFLDDADPYMSAVERETAPFRVGKATRANDRAEAILAREMLEALPPELEEAGWRRSEEPAPPLPSTPLEALERSEDRRARARWHSSRAKGALERFPRVRDCGMKKKNTGGKAKAIATCSRSCGLVRKLDIGCGVGRLCVECRAAAAVERKERLLEAQNRTMRRLQRSGLTSKYRGPNRWGAKFLTLTVPHVQIEEIEGAREACESRGCGDASIAVCGRVALAREAWRYFSLELQAWSRVQRKATRDRGRVAWYRAFEWTPGHDGLGHPHFHLWIVCPFLPHELVRAWWSAALARAGLPGTSPVVDIEDWTMPIHELVKGAKTIKGQKPSIAQYVEGWSIVDTINGTQIPPEVAARLYEALDGARLVQTSSRFLKPLVDICPACGCHGSTDVRIVSPNALELVVGELGARGAGPPE